MSIGRRSLLLARHGESTWNASGRWQGQADPPLSPLGEEQARAAARWVAQSIRVDVVVSSDLRRARQTAQHLAIGLGVEVVVEPRLRERDAGEWTGLTRAEIDARFPGWLSQRRHPPGFEADAPLLERVLPALADLAGAGPATQALVVTHGGVVRTVERHLGADAPPLPNLAARELTGSRGSWQLGERMLLLDGHRPGDGFVTVPAQI